MSVIDHFKVQTPDGRNAAVVVTQDVDDNTWFELYATGQSIGKLHWRADIDAYIALSRTGSACGRSTILAEAEDILVREAGLAISTSVVAAQS